MSDLTLVELQRWVDRYLEAWRSADASAIAGLFTDDATYAHAPWKDPLRGSSAIVDDWLANADPPDSWEATYVAAFVCGDIGIVKGETHYPAEAHSYANLFEVRLVDGRCSSFVEWHMRMPHAG